MLEFQKPTMQDRDWVTQIMRNAGELACEYCFGNLFMWSAVYHNTVTRYGDLFLARDGNARPMYLFPCGTGDKKRAVEELFRCAQADGVPLTLYGLTPKKVRELDSLYPDAFTFTEERDYFDYIYNTADLTALAGRKYHGKRNHIAYFKKTYDWHFEPITPLNIEACRTMNEKWVEQNREKNPEELDREQIAIRRAFDHFFDLQLQGGLLRADGEVVAYTFGEAMHDRIFCTHVEKAFADIRGAYPAVNREFAAQMLSAFPLINREEDTGSEGLRRAKLSYYPAVLLPKYRAVYKG